MEIHLKQLIRTLAPNMPSITDVDIDDAATLAALRYKTDRGDGDIPDKDLEAVANWGAAFLLDKLANECAGAHSPTIQADSVDHGGKTANYAERARVCRQLYFDHLGIDPKRTVAHGVVVESPRPPRLTKGRPV